MQESDKYAFGTGAPKPPEQVAGGDHDFGTDAPDINELADSRAKTDETLDRIRAMNALNEAALTDIGGVAAGDMFPEAAEQYESLHPDRLPVVVNDVSKLDPKPTAQSLVA